MSDFQQWVHQELSARARRLELQALAVLGLDGLLVAGLAIAAGLSEGRTEPLLAGLALARGAPALIALAALLLAGLCSALALWGRGAPLVRGQPDVASYDEYLQAVRRLTGDAVREELARRSWAEQESLRGRQRWLNAALALTLAGLLCFGLFSLPALF